MAGHRGELLLMVLAGTLFLVQVQGWDWIDEFQLQSLYETGQWSESLNVRAQNLIPATPMMTTDDGKDYDEGGSGLFENEGMVVKGHATSPDPALVDPTQVEFDASPSNWVSRTIGPNSDALSVFCSNAGFEITLLMGQLNDVKVLASKDLVTVEDAPGSCGYNVNHQRNILTVPFTGCNVKEQANGYSVQLLHVDVLGHIQVSTVSCEKTTKSARPYPRAKPEKCNNPTSAPTPTTKFIPTTTRITTRAPTTASKKRVCAVPAGERISCGGAGISSLACKKMGCCVDSSTSACYYTLDECTADQHFVFAIRYNSAPINVDPTKLIMPKSPSCKPVIVNDKVAIFKFKVTECGTLAYEVGEVKVYLAEVQTIIEALNLKYGVITRSDPVRFMVECSYSKSGKALASLASVGYMVKAPASTLPTSIISNGLYGVQLRMATDETYTQFYPNNYQPLWLLLGNPVYLELRLRSPEMDAVILVNYCLAYPRSATKALVLVYEGCANPNDPHVSILKIGDFPDNRPRNRKQRRFKVSAFQFMNQKTNKYLDEEIYFMCSAEVCRPAEKTCSERCFDGKAP
ncbi:zona pellucida sperm-binding protein 4-like [Parambassis ranga]|uniref:Zona pellucida sperm-binding protein 4-like n=1 Tax=Parambassis ranga TaxID=210632 RepID=A0A6P7I8F9_9TELE|nr:zona pellucida sperm-binding protein 4-like [Parambassis ranga]